MLVNNEKRVKTYTAEFKARALKLAVESDQPSLIMGVLPLTSGLSIEILVTSIKKI